MVVFHHSCAVKPSSSYLRSSPHTFLSFQCCVGVVAPPAAVASDVHQHYHNFLFFLGKRICLASTSDLSIMKQSKIGKEGDKENNGGVRLKLKLPRAEVEKLIQECKDEAEAAEKIMRLCMANGSIESESEIVEENGERSNIVLDQQMHNLKGGRDRVNNSTKTRESTDRSHRTIGFLL